jgi:hypothetical protein
MGASSLDVRKSVSLVSLLESPASLQSSRVISFRRAMRSSKLEHVNLFMSSRPVFQVPRSKM